MARREERTQEHELRKRSRAWATSSIVSSNPLSPYPPLLPNPYHPIAPDTKHLPPYTPMMPNPYPRITVDTKPPIKCTYFSNVEHHLQALACVEVLGAVEVRAQHVDQGPVLAEADEQDLGQAPRHLPSHTVKQPHQSSISDLMLFKLQQQQGRRITSCRVGVTPIMGTRLARFGVVTRERISIASCNVTIRLQGSVITIPSCKVASSKVASSCKVA